MFKVSVHDFCTNGRQQRSRPLGAPGDDIGETVIVGGSLSYDAATYTLMRDKAEGRYLPGVIARLSDVRGHG